MNSPFHGRRAWTSASPILGCAFLVGCAESQFNLANESRLPVWFTLPREMNRSNVELEMIFYIVGRPNPQADFIIRTRAGRVIARATGDVRDLKPMYLGTLDKDGHTPSYEVITVNGVAELIEIRSTFSIVDDEVLRKKAGLPPSQ